MPTLWMAIKEWLNISSNKNVFSSNNSINFVASEDLEYLKSSCTFYNNFEIGAFSLFRDKSYLEFFEYLDKEGGFYYERWGDAPVHTYWILGKLNKNQIHFFSDIPYSHQHGSNYRLDESDNEKCNVFIDGCNSKWIDFSI
jgi:alpha 1,2-mannosyltransferase